MPKSPARPAVLRRLLPLGLLALLAACGTPQEQCIRQGTRDLTVLDRLIAESRATLERGYALAEVETSSLQWRPCGYPRPAAPGKPAPPPPMCMVEVPQWTTRPVSVDLKAEQAKLASMEVKRKELARAAEPHIRSCKAQFPE